MRGSFEKLHASGSYLTVHTTTKFPFSRTRFVLIGRLRRKIKKIQILGPSCRDLQTTTYYVDKNMSRMSSKVTFSPRLRNSHIGMADPEVRVTRNAAKGHKRAAYVLMACARSEPLRVVFR